VISSPNSLAILGIIAHFIDDQGKVQHCTLALQEIVGENTGKSLAKAVLEVLRNGIYIKIRILYDG
jgi:hypothetical protein